MMVVVMATVVMRMVASINSVIFGDEIVDLFLQFGYTSKELI